MEERRLLYGYDLDEVDETASELFAVIAEAQVPTTFAILALAKAISLIGSEEELDLACIMIDQLREAAEDEQFDIDEEEDEDEE